MIYGALKKGGRRVRAEVSRAEANGFRYVPSCEERRHQKRKARLPNLPGQDAFGAIQEVVRILDADPKTDWSRVDIAGLREHLIDMNEVTLHAAATEKRLDNGVEILVSGEGRTPVSYTHLTLPTNSRV